MFAGTGGLADYSLPEDSTFRGASLLLTPSPTTWPNSSPAESPAKRPRSTSELGSGQGTALALAQTLKNAAGQSSGPAGCPAPPEVKETLETALEISSSEPDDGAPGPVDALAAAELQLADSQFADTQLADSQFADSQSADPPAAVVPAEELVQIPDEPPAAAMPAEELVGTADEPPVAAVVPAEELVETADEEEAPAVASSEPSAGAGGPVVQSPEAGPKTFAGRYKPKTALGAETWTTRKNLFFNLVPAEYQTAKLQLSFWKFCSIQVGCGATDRSAAEEFVRLGRLMTQAE